MTEKYYNLIKELEDTTSQESKIKQSGKSGIYAIYCDERLVYIGKSTDLLKRFIAHKANTICDESKEYNSKKYVELRNAMAAGHNICIKVIEYCEKKDLEAKEDYYIGMYLPPLNTIIPNGRGGHTTKGVSHLI